MEVLPLSKTGLTNTEAHAENVSKAWECHFFLPFLKQLIPRPPTSWKKLQKTPNDPKRTLAIYRSITAGSLRSRVLKRKKAPRELTARNHFTRVLSLFSHVTILHHSPIPHHPTRG